MDPYARASPRNLELGSQGTAALVPWPGAVKIKPGRFELGEPTSIVADKALLPEARLLQNALRCRPDTTSRDSNDPEIERNCTPASPATARAKSVLPVPGGPTRRMPFEIRAPRRP